MSASFKKTGERTLRFIGRQQQNAITNRNKGAPVLKPKIKLLKKSKRKSLRGTA